MAKKKSRRRSRGLGIPPVSIIAGVLPGVANVLGGFQAAGLRGAAQTASVIYTGYDPNTGQWNLAWMGRGTMPILIGFLVHRVASRVGINRTLASARIPFRI